MNPTVYETDSILQAGSNGVSDAMESLVDSLAQLLSPSGERLWTHAPPSADGTLMSVDRDWLHSVVDEYLDAGNRCHLVDILLLDLLVYQEYSAFLLSKKPFLFGLRHRFNLGEMMFDCYEAIESHDKRHISAYLAAGAGAGVKWPEQVHKLCAETALAGRSIYA